MRLRSMLVRTPAKGEDCLRRVARSLSSVIRAATIGQGCARIRCHSCNHDGGRPLDRALQRARFRRGISSNSGSRSIFCAITACIARLRASSTLCVEYAVFGGPFATHATTGFNPAAFLRSRIRRMRSAAVIGWPEGGRPRGLLRFPRGMLIYLA